MSTHIRFLIHVFLVSLFVPISMYVMVVERNWREPYGELHLLLSIFIFSVLPYLIAIKLYPYRDDCIGVKLDYRFSRILIIVAIPILTFFAMAFFYHDVEFFDSSMDAIMPLAFYVGIYWYFRKYWKCLFNENPS